MMKNKATSEDFKDTLSVKKSTEKSENTENDDDELTAYETGDKEEEAVALFQLRWFSEDADEENSDGQDNILESESEDVDGETAVILFRS